MKNPKYLLPETIIYEEIARDAHEMRLHGHTWRDIAYEYAARYEELGLTIGQWSNLLHNAYYRAGYSSTPLRQLKPEEEDAVRTVAAKDSYEQALAEKKAKEVKAAYRDQNYTPAVYTADYMGGDHLRIGIISDTHFGSHWTQYTHLREFYEVSAAAGVTDIYHAGDLDDGSETMHVGVMHEHHAIGANKHIDNIVENYPHIDGITTHFITGNHDASFGKACGLEIGPMVAERRPDLHYLGRDIAHVQLSPNCKMELRHPGDGSAYAISYKLQKMLDTYDWDDHPDIVVVGHYHKYVTVYHRGMLLMHPGCFQGLTDFMRAKQGYAAIGGVIMDITLDADGRMIAATPTWLAYKEIKDDWKNL